MGISIAGDLIGGALGMIGQNTQNQANAAQAQKAMDFSAQQAQIARDYNTSMANTSWQRGVADMRQAGLNPALAYQQGGASSPTSMAPGGQQAQMGNVLGAGLSGAQQAAQVQNTFADTAKTMAEAHITEANAKIADQQAAANLYLTGAKGQREAIEGRQTDLQAQFLQNTMDPRIATARSAADIAAAQVGQIKAGTALDTERLNTQLQLSKLQNYAQQAAGLGIQHEQNLNAMENTWYGKHIAPYMSGAQSATGILSKIATHF